MRGTIAVVVLLVAAACSPGGAERTVAGAPSGPGDVGVVRIAGADGLLLVGDLAGVVPGREQPGVLLLHMLGSNRFSWAPLVDALVARGYVTLAIDLRGHGDTGGDVDWDRARDDVAAALDYLATHEGVDGGRLAVVGASIGANLALVLAAGHPEVRAVVALSPGIDYRGVETTAAMGGLAGRVVWLLASRGDGYSAESVRTLGGVDPEAVVTILPGDAHGTAMFRADVTLGGRIAEFLDRALDVDG